MSRRNHLLFGLVFFISGVVLVCSWWQMSKFRSMAQQSVAQLQACFPLANQLSLLKAEQDSYELVLPADHQPGKRVANAYQQASIAIQDPRISVRPGKVLKDGNLEARHLEIPKLEKIELSQLVRFLNYLQNSDGQYRLDRIVLTPSPENRIAGTPKSLWNAECELLFYVESTEQ